MWNKFLPLTSGVAAAMYIVSALAEPSVFPTGVTLYDPQLADNVYVIFAGPDHKTRLIDMNGNVVREWAYAGFPSELLDPKVAGGKLGHVLVQLSTDERAGAGIVPHMPAEFRNKTIGELDWDGKIVWQWGEQAPGGAARQHHDQFREANGNTLILANAFHPISGFRLPNILDDVIYDITPGGKIVWSWQAAEHLNEIGFKPDQMALLRAVKTPDYLHINDMTALGPNRWFDAGDERFTPDNILFDSRNANFIAIIDRKTGHLVWTLGPNFSESTPSLQVPRPVDQISGQHDAHLIEAGLPGAGDLLVFDNQGEGGYPPVPLGVNSGSRVLEINPATKQIVWQYTAEMSGKPGWTFYSSFISSARRLPNGNTLIDEGMNGRLFQVTPTGVIAWEYVSPFFAPSPVGSAAKEDVDSNWVYRAQPVPYDWVPAGTPHAETPVKAQRLSGFRVAVSP